MIELDFEISQSIEEVLIAEIAQGNRVVEISRDWPEKKSILIILERPFYKKYKKDNLEYRNLNDPHYWKEEYHDNINGQTIACRF